MGSPSFVFAQDWRARPTLKQNSWRFGLQRQRPSRQNGANLRLSEHLLAVLTIRKAPSEDRFNSLALHSQRRAAALNSAVAKLGIQPKIHITEAFCRRWVQLNSVAHYTGAGNGPTVWLVRHSRGNGEHG